jgi:hypothetical protein
MHAAKSHPFRPVAKVPMLKFSIVKQAIIGKGRHMETVNQTRENHKNTTQDCANVSTLTLA